MRKHGFEPGCFKADLYNVGGDLFRSQKSLWLKKNLLKDFQKIELKSAPKAWGGTWGSARGLVLQFKNLEAEIGDEIGLERRLFPEVDPEKNLYLCDILEAPIFDENKTLVGHLSRFYETSPGNLSLEVTRADGQGVFEFPSAWIDFKVSSAEAVVVPEISQWMKLK